MTIEQTPTGDQTARISLKISKADYEPEVEKELKQYRRNVQMPGFRKGEVPMGMLRKRVGHQMMMDSLNKLVNDGLNNHIREANLRLIGNPLPTQEAPEAPTEDGDFTFTFDVGMWPDTKVVLPQGTFTKYHIELTEADIAQQVEQAREYHFKDAYPTESADGDSLLGVAQPIAETEERTESKKYYPTIRLGDIADADLRAKFIGLKKDDTVDVNLEEVYGANRTELARALRTTEDELSQSYDPNVRFKLSRILRKGQAPMDQDFFDKVLGPGMAHDEESFNEQFRLALQMQADKAADDRLMNDILAQTMNENEVPLPEAWVVRTIIENAKEGERPSEAEVQDYLHNKHAQEMKSSFITSRLLEQHDQTVAHQEILDRVAEDVRNTYLQYGVEDPDAAMVTKAANDFLQKDDNYNNVANTLQRDRLASILLGNVHVEPQVVSLAQFQTRAADAEEQDADLQENEN